jgi:hypothetical protein
LLISVQDPRQPQPRLLQLPKQHPRFPSVRRHPPRLEIAGAEALDFLPQLAEVALDENVPPQQAVISQQVADHAGREDGAVQRASALPTE